MTKKSIAKAAAAILFLGVTGWVVARQAQKQEQTMTPGEVDALIASDTTVVLLDVRTPAEWNGTLGHMKDALLIPLPELEQRVSELEQHRGRTIVVYCRTGNRSGKAASILNEKGFKAYNMVGGMVRWNAEHRPSVVESQP